MNHKNHKNHNNYRYYVKLYKFGLLNEEIFVIEIFSDTNIRRTQFVKISTLEGIVKHTKNLNLIPELYFIEDGKIEVVKEEILNVQDLIDNCESVRLWFKEYHPEYLV